VPAKFNDAAEMPAGPDTAVAYYRVKAELCQSMAAQTIDPEMREQWLQLANQWNYLVLHANQKAIEPTPARRTEGS
jgi:hypothetical protein